MAAGIRVSQAELPSFYNLDQDLPRKKPRMNESEKTRVAPFVTVRDGLTALTNPGMLGTTAQIQATHVRQLMPYLYQYTDFLEPSYRSGTWKIRLWMIQ